MMKTAITMVTALALVTFLGCKSTSERGGGASRDEGFRIVAPSLTQEVKQGEMQAVIVTVLRGDNFKRDVSLEIKPSKGLNVEPTFAKVRASDKADVQLRIVATKDTSLGEYRIYVKGTPETGESATAEFAVKVIAP